MVKEKKKAPEQEQDDSDKKDIGARNVYIFGRLENEIVIPVIRRLLRLAERDSVKPINLYINSSGGNGYNADAVIAIMHSIEPKVNTICLGHALSGACEILASGTGERIAYEFSTLMFHQTIWEAEGDITNLEIQAAQGKRFRDAQIELLHRVTGHTIEKLTKDIERDHYLSATEAKRYGLIDSIMKFKSLTSAAKRKPASTRARTQKTTSTRAKKTSRKR